MPLLPYRDPSPSPTLIWATGHLTRRVILPFLTRISRIDFPEADQQRFAEAVNPSTAAFVTPSHPEFMTDWMIDKELSRRHAPLMASWAANDIVNASRFAQRFWLANNLIAAAPGGGGKAFSLAHARQGRGVLLHPEGKVSWQAERVAPVHTGAVDMAMSAAEQLEHDNDSRPVLIVPVAWRMTFRGDASVALLDEMSHIERHCALSVWPSLRPADRLAGLLGALLTQQAHRLGLRRPALWVSRFDSQYFEAQALIQQELRARLLGSCGVKETGDSEQELRAIHRSLRRRAQKDEAGVRRDQQLLGEYMRLAHLDAALYGRETLTQEQIAEILKATRAAVVKSGLRNTLHNFMPRPVASRTAHIRTGAAIDVREAARNGVSSDVLVLQLRGALQQLQDVIGAEVESIVSPRRMTNPMWLYAATQNNRAEAERYGVLLRGSTPVAAASTDGSIRQRRHGDVDAVEARI